MSGGGGSGDGGLTKQQQKEDKAKAEALNKLRVLFGLPPVANEDAGISVNDAAPNALDFLLGRARQSTDDGGGGTGNSNAWITGDPRMPIENSIERLPIRVNRNDSTTGRSGPPVDAAQFEGKTPEELHALALAMPGYKTAYDKYLGGSVYGSEQNKNALEGIYSGVENAARDYYSTTHNKKLRDLNLSTRDQLARQGLTGSKVDVDEFGKINERAAEDSAQLFSKAKQQSDVMRDDILRAFQTGSRDIAAGGGQGAIDSAIAAKSLASSNDSFKTDPYQSLLDNISGMIAYNTPYQAYNEAFNANRQPQRSIAPRSARGAYSGSRNTGAY